MESSSRMEDDGWGSNGCRRNFVTGFPGSQTLCEIGKKWGNSMVNKNRIVWLASLILLLTGSNGERPEVVFQAKVANLGLTQSSFAQGKKPDETVQVVLPGQLYNPPKSITTVNKNQATRESPEEALVTDISAMRSADVDWILSNWHPSERQELKKFLTQEEIWKRNTDWLMENPKLQISGSVNYKGMTLILLENDHLVFTFKQENGQWFRTNSLSGDEGFDLVFAAWKLDGRVFQVE